MITIPMSLAIVAAREGGWDYRLAGVESPAISLVSERPFPTAAAARTAASDRLAAFNHQFSAQLKMILTSK